MPCYECGWPTMQRVRGGDSHCPRCGTQSSRAEAKSQPNEQPSRVVKTYTSVLAVWALVLPFLVPIIIKISLANP